MKYTVSATVEISVDADSPQEAQSEVQSILTDLELEDIDGTFSIDDVREGNYWEFKS